MTTFSTVLFWLFALLWGVTGLAGLALPRLDLPELERAGWIIDIAFGWGNAQAGAAMALSAAAWLCAVAGRPGLAALGIGLVVTCLALAAATLDPRVTGLLPDALAGPYNALRADLAFLRLGGFLGLALAGGACLFARGGVAVDRWLVAVAQGAILVALAAAAATTGVASLPLLILPALIVLLILALRMSEEELSGGAYAIAAILALLVGLGLLAAGAAGPRIDLRPAFAALPLLMLAAARRRPAVPAWLAWLHAVATLGAMAWLSPGMAPALDLFGSGAAPTSLTEIRAALLRDEQLRNAAGLVLVGLTLIGLVVIRMRRTDRAPAPAGISSAKT